MCGLRRWRARAQTAAAGERQYEQGNGAQPHRTLGPPVVSTWASTDIPGFNRDAAG